MGHSTEMDSESPGDGRPPNRPSLETNVENRPTHIAIIMDGNGRWAERQNQPRLVGHQNGAISVRAITEECARLNIRQLTLYCLSSENWKRPQEELDFLMHLLQEYLVKERDLMVENNIQLRIIGRRDRLPDDVLEVMDQSLELTANNTGLILCLAINYGSRAEIVDAIHHIAHQVKKGELQVEEIKESTVSDHLYTCGMTDPDLLIRTAGEMRISNYLLWQISYAELWITEKLWPEFGVHELHQAIQSFASRDRRFGGLKRVVKYSDRSLPSENKAPKC